MRSRCGGYKAAGDTVSCDGPVPLPLHALLVRKLPAAEILRPSPDELSLLPRYPVDVVLDNIRSAYNVGSIFRTADAARIRHIYITGYTPTPEHRSVAKTALGAEHTVPWSHAPNAFALLDQLRADGVTLAALEQTDTPTHIESVTAERFPLAFVLGNEVSGVQQEILDRCDLALEIPQYGAKHSLNVSVAFGIAAYGLVERSRGRV